jgi:hypothetical protein
MTDITIPELTEWTVTLQPRHSDASVYLVTARFADGYKCHTKTRIKGIDVARNSIDAVEMTVRQIGKALKEMTLNRKYEIENNVPYRGDPSDIYQSSISKT